MNAPLPIEPAALIGILMMDTDIRRIPGDVGNPSTFPFPILRRTVPGAGLERLIRQRDPSLVTPFVEGGSELVRRGVQALTTSCGFMILFQEELSAALPVPVFTSSLLQLPLVQRGLSPHRRIGVITADAANLTAQHLLKAGGDLTRLTVRGLEEQPHFREAIFGGCGRIDPQGVEAEVVALARRMTAEEPAIGALVLECTNLPPYAAAIRKAVGLPVYDIVTLIRHLHSALARTAFPP
ncbi:MAG: aspartate/glutamate racemase family protein [Desulfobacterales bacterium]|nr:aspartate/glutamate racemase family protein [Desulfobacterales bacterium]